MPLLKLQSGCSASQGSSRVCCFALLILQLSCPAQCDCHCCWRLHHDLLQQAAQCRLEQWTCQLNHGYGWCLHPIATASSTCKPFAKLLAVGIKVTHQATVAMNVVATTTIVTSLISNSSDTYADKSAPLALDATVCHHNVSRSKLLETPCHASGGVNTITSSSSLTILSSVTDANTRIW